MSTQVNPKAKKSTQAWDFATIKKMRWFFIALIVIAGVINYLDRSTLSIGNSTIAEELSLTTVQMGLLLSAFSWPVLLQSWGSRKTGVE
ncbi:MAG TPA: hypothetical protein K8W18_13200 [Corynebacterium glutamicum]|nr:hypothetical protein [Corynebacterium glutamicum]